MQPPRYNTLPGHRRFAYSAIDRRATYDWPNGARLAVYLALNIEHFAFGEGLGANVGPASPAPDVLNYAWREYGNRVGVWRCLELFDALQLPAGALINTALYDHCPQVVAACVERGHELIAHGHTNAERQGEFTEDEERALLRSCRDTMLRHSGTIPTGWLSPWISESRVTPDLLRETGCGDDWSRLTASGASIAHCPAVFARTGEALDSFGRYRAGGINLGLGTDTWPPDLLHNMQLGLYLARVVEGSAQRTSIADLYNAATLGGARALGRDDLGRLAPGAQADIVVFDLGAPHLGPFFDPFKNLLLAGRGTDCRASYIAGRCVMEDFQLPGCDLAALQAQADRQFGKLVASHQDRAFADAPKGRLFHPVFPWAG